MDDLVAFTDVDLDTAGGRELLGGKGWNLAVMARRLELPVPPGFVLTTRLCNRYLAEGWPDDLDERLAAALAGLEERSGRRFGAADKPLLVSVRSGAPVSMPGMMDTVLDVGINAEVRRALAAETGDDAFAADCELRFRRLYADIVLGLPAAEIAQVEAIARGDRAADDPAGMLAAIEAVGELADEVGGIPDDPHQQLRYCVEAVFGSWQSDRAVRFRAREGIADDLGTAAVVQAMVFGNLDDRSGTGVYFTRNPSTGEDVPYGDYLADAQGEDVVAGTHQVEGLDALADQLPEIHRELLAAGRRLERYERDLCDIEFTVSGGILYFLQTRVGRRSPAAAVRVAVEMAQDPDFPLTRREALARVDRDVVDQLASTVAVDPSAEAAAEGLAASPGVAAGVLCTDPDAVEDLVAEGHPVVLARPETSPADVGGMVASAALMTALGGVVSHAAVVARSWGLPAVTGIESLVVRPDGVELGGRWIPAGGWVTVDGSTGRILLGDARCEGSTPPPSLEILRRWATEEGVEIGTPLPDDEPADRTATEDVDAFTVLRTLGLKGLAKPATVAAALGADDGQVEEVLRCDEELVRCTDRGAMLTPAGREWVAERLGAECAAVGTGLDDAYERFLPLNREFKEIVTGWQGTDQSPAALAETATKLDDLHARFGPIVEAAGATVPRLSGFGRRFDEALAAVHAGEARMVASPLADSYHTVWFEFHEELIALSGRDRATEEAAEAEGAHG